MAKESIGDERKPLWQRRLVSVPWEILRIGRNLLAGMPGYWAFKRAVCKTAGTQGRVVNPIEYAAYAFRCRDELLQVLAAHQIPLSGHMLEIGPGDNVGPAMLLVAAGIEHIVAIDRFPQLRTGTFQQIAYKLGA
jgi:hypothetical protein